MVEAKGVPDSEIEIITTAFLKPYRFWKSGPYRWERGDWEHGDRIYLSQNDLYSASFFGNETLVNKETLIKYLEKHK